ncbi:hypothetical protein A7U60_g5316 [Sanghuangporus baumii]|uniref:Hydrophobin n=1 Tax=Sanghuangporus baumii TaxID=108892 RepID=A0A9Q5HX27_SANBA|nr:hypothetical protein A7U60_g5316 [Sanghuangporus baumii]
MKVPRISDYFCLCFLLATLFDIVAAGVSKGPGPSRVRTSTSPTPTPSVALCKKNPVQCCDATAESNSTTAASVFERLGIQTPEKTVEIGFNCTSMSDEDISGGFCDNSILCCYKIFNDTLYESSDASALARESQLYHIAHGAHRERKQGIFMDVL